MATATVNWRRGLAKVLVPAALALGYVLWRNGGTSHSSIRFWGIIALLFLPEMAAGLAGHYLEQTGRPGVGKLVGFAGLAWLFGGVFFLVTKTQAVTLADAERAPLVTVDENNQRRLRHPTLGFSLLHPGPGFVADDASAIRSSAHFYSFTDSEARVRISVGLFKGEGDTSGSLRDLLEGMSKNMDAVAGPAARPARVEKLEVSGEEPPRGALEMVLGDGRHYRTRAYGWRSPDGAPFAILIAVTAHSYAPGSAVLASFRP
jgi:hypothetical protein